MRMTRKGHTHWKVIEGGKPQAAPDHAFIRLRQEQAKDDPARGLTPEEVEALRTNDRDKP